MNMRDAAFAALEAAITALEERADRCPENGAAQQDFQSMAEELREVMDDYSHRRGEHVV